MLAVGFLCSIVVLAVAVALASRPRTPLELALTAALVAYAWLIATAFALSVVNAFERGPLVGATAVAAVGALACRPWRWAGNGWRDQPSLRISLPELTLEPRMVALAAVAAGSLAYSLGLALFTPAAEVDAIAYHLTRAAFWVQQHAVGTIPGAADPRIDDSPPGAEIVAAQTMIITSGTRFVGMVQWLSVPVACGAVAGIARRLGAARAEAAFAGLVVASLPVVALQTPTALNDVVVAALVAVAAYFLLGGRRVDALLAGLAVAALVLTKTTAIVAVPVLVAVALAAPGRRLRRQSVGALVAGTATGTVWVVLHHERAGRTAVGGVQTRYFGSLEPLAVLGRLSRLSIELLELPGAVGADVLLYLGAAAVLVVLATVPALPRRPLLGAAALAALTPLLVPVAHGALRAHQKTWFELGRTRAEHFDAQREVDLASATSSWYGAVGLVVFVLGCAAGARRRARRRGALYRLLALAPAIWLVAFATILGYSPWEARFMMPGMLLGAAAVAPWLYRPTLAWWVIAVSATTLVLVWTHSSERPAGLRLLDSPTPRSVWTRDDARAMGVVRAMPEAIRFVSRVVPQDARLAVFPAPFPDPSTSDPVALHPWPFFGSSLGRVLVYADTLEQARLRGANWALFPRFLVTGCRAGWRRRTAPDALYQAFVRDPRVGCPRQSDGRPRLTE